MELGEEKITIILKCEVPQKRWMHKLFSFADQQLCDLLLAYFLREMHFFLFANLTTTKGRTAHNYIAWFSASRSWCFILNFSLNNKAPWDVNRCINDTDFLSFSRVSVVRFFAKRVAALHGWKSSLRSHRFRIFWWILSINFLKLYSIP